MKGVAILGSTGTIGVNTLDVIERNPWRVQHDVLALFDLQHAIEPLQALSRETFSRWIDRFEIPPRPHRLPSR